MNIWVEFFMYDEKQISRRFFNKQQDAMDFAKSLGEQGYHATIKQDSGGYQKKTASTQTFDYSGRSESPNNE